MIQTRPCKRCGKDTTQELSKKVIASGGEFFGWWCLTCKWWTYSKTGGMWIAKTLLESNGIDLSSLPVVATEIGPRCVKCGQRGAEENHWAPKAIFGSEADNWPKDMLCKPCHAEWHAKVTPQFFKK